MEVVRRLAMKTYTIPGNKHQVTDWVEQPIKMFLIKVEEFFFYMIYVLPCTLLYTIRQIVMFILYSSWKS